MALLLDLAIIAMILLNAIQGWRDGFIASALGLLAAVAGVVVALRLYDDVSPHVESLVGIDPAFAPSVSFVLLLVGSGLLFGVLTTVFVAKLPKRLRTNGMNRLFGLVPGIVTGIIGMSVASALLLALPLPAEFGAAARQSTLMGPLAGLTQRLGEQVQPIFGDALDATVKLRTIHPESDEMVELGYTVANALPRPDLALEMVVLVNQERTARGLPELSFDDRLAAVAEAHSRDMFEHGYFSHYTPDGLSPFDRLQQANVPYRVAGENLAHAPTLAIAHDGLMASPGHRENLLRPEFGRIGISVLDGGPRGLMITQLFQEP